MHAKMPGMTHTEQQDQAISQDLHSQGPQPTPEATHGPESKQSTEEQAPAENHATESATTDVHENPGPKKSPAAIITIVVIVLAVVIGVALFLNRQAAETTSGPTPSPTTTSGMIPHQYGMDNELIFSYPATWYPHDKHGMLFFLKAPNTPDKDGTEIYAYGQQITVIDSNLTDDKGNQLTRAQYDAHIKKNPPANKDIEGNPIYRTNVTINGIPMVRIDQLEYLGTYRTLTYEILKGNLIYQIRLYPYQPDKGDAAQKQSIKDFEALMQTVRFAE